MSYTESASHMNCKNRTFNLLLFAKETLFCMTGHQLVTWSNLPSQDAPQSQLPSHTMHAIVIHIICSYDIM